jgi:adenylate cyclase
VAGLGVPSAAASRLSIVVLPFANLSNDAEQEYFADSITDDLTGDLSRIADSFVIARTTAFSYKGKPIDVKQIGRDLAVRYVLEGSVRRFGNSVQINVQLIDSETGSHVWTDRFDTDRSDLTEAQSEITSRLARTLSIQLVRDAGRRIEQEHTANPDARDLAMRARALWSQTSSATVNRQALDLLQRALALDPELVTAKIITANILVSGIGDGFSSSVDQDRARAEQLLDEALERDPQRSLVHSTLALLRRVQGRWAESESELETAISLDPNNAGAIRQQGQLAMIQGKPDKAVPYIEKGIRLDPRSPNIWNAYLNLGRCYLFLGRNDEAVHFLSKARTIAPGIWYVHLSLAGALGLGGDIDSAKREIAEAVKLKPEANSIARYRAIAASAGFDHPAYLSLRDKTLDAGLRLAGFPEE